MTTCEIRVPTFRRLGLLERALRSVLAQTYSDWRCVVFDDCPDGSAEGVVAAMKDGRFEYRRNERSLGAIGNIDQGFRNRSMAGGEYALVLEDDNYLLSEHLKTQLDTCCKYDVSVVLSAQLVEEIVEPGLPGRISRHRTLSWIYPEGRYSSSVLLPAVLFSHAFSNGGVFWRLGCASDFEIGDLTRHPGIQETLRMLKLKDDVFVSHRATAVWRSNDPRDSYVSRVMGRHWTGKLRSRWHALALRREIHDYRVWYLSRFGISYAVQFIRCLNREHSTGMERGILLSGRYVVMTDRPVFWRIAKIIRGYVFRAIVRRQLDMRRIEQSVGMKAGA